MNEKWYAVYTRPKWEKKVAATLTEINVENYCPLNRVVRQWSDRKKVVYEPLFSSYVFLHVNEKQHARLREINGIIRLVHWQGKPAVIRDVEIEIIRHFLNEHSNVRIESPDVHVHDPVRVTRGPLMDREGVVVLLKNNTVKVALDSLGCIIYAELEKSSIEPLKQANYHDQYNSIRYASAG